MVSNERVTMPRGRDEDSGQYTEQYPLEDFLDALRAEGGQAGTQDIADYVGCSNRLALDRLRELTDSDEIEHQRIGNAHLWIVVTEGDE